MRTERFLIPAGFTAISILWGSTWLAIKIGLESVPPFFGVALRFTAALVILLLIHAVRGIRIPFTRDSAIIYATVGFSSFSIPFALVYWGEQYVPSGLASVLFAIYPFVVALYSHLFLPNEKLTLFKVVGILLGFSGILVIFWADIHVGQAGTLGMGAILVSTLLQGIALIVVKRKALHIEAITLNAGGMILGLPVMYLLAFVTEDPHSIRLDAAGLGSILYLGSFGTVVTFTVYYWLLKRVEAVYLSLTAMVTPILALVLGTFLLGEVFSPKVFVGAAFVLTGILIANARELVKRGARINHDHGHSESR
jgi:drug/metabolite transporter (DMT)-like permease